jgi:hypothetical protein
MLSWYRGSAHTLASGINTRLQIPRTLQLFCVAHQNSVASQSEATCTSRYNRLALFPDATTSQMLGRPAGVTTETEYSLPQMFPPTYTPDTTTQPHSRLMCPNVCLQAWNGGCTESLGLMSEPGSAKDVASQNPSMTGVSSSATAVKVRLDCAANNEYLGRIPPEMCLFHYWRCALYHQLSTPARGCEALLLSNYWIGMHADAQSGRMQVLIVTGLAQCFRVGTALNYV